MFFLHFRKKSCRTITFDEFKVALGELARKKYKEKPGEEAEAEVFKLIEGKGPVIAGVTVRFKSHMHHIMLVLKMITVIFLPPNRELWLPLQ